MSSKNVRMADDETAANGTARQNATNEDDATLSAKRAALAGQWRTPPAPAYPSGSSQQQHAAAQSSATANAQVQGGQQSQIPAPADITAPTTLPGTSEDYAKALQEAYRKGAEAAARAAQQAAAPPPASSGPESPPVPLPTAASCPDFTAPTSITTMAAAPATSYTPTGVPDPLVGTMAPVQVVHQHPHLQQQPHPQHRHVVVQHVQYAAAPQPGQQLQTIVYAQPPPTASPHPPITQSMQVAGVAPIPAPQATTSGGLVQGTPVLTSVVHPGATAQPSTTTTATTAPSTAPAPPPPPPAATRGPVPPSQSTTTMRTAVSMPDMSSFAAKAEDDKRQKRLARNRASARLRRLRKKNLVDAYETEVGILEKTLKQLQSHEWGKDDDHKALLEALGMERGQQAIPPEQRTQIIQDILQQQMQQVQLLRQAQMEQQCLAMVANQLAEDSEMNGADDDLARELQDILQLTDEQKSQLRESSKGLDEEVEALETVSASLQAMHDNKWLVNDGVQKMTDQFMSILHQSQKSKFLLWTDANSEAIDQLDYVNVQPLQSAPVFTFGVETNPGDDDDK